MSRDALSDFLGRLTTDTSLQQELQALANGGTRDVSDQEIVDFAASRGYRFSVNDISGELSDESLEAVAGGVARIYSFLAKK